MKVLFIGGTGIISSACTRLAAERGIKLTLLNRGNTTLRQIPSTIPQIHADIRSISETRRALKGQKFDVVVDWLSFTTEHVKTALNLFASGLSQYIFISSASAYQKPVPQLPITEKTPLENPFWQYSRDKQTCEEYLMNCHVSEKLPVTIVRPSHTYDCTSLPVRFGYTVIDRMKRGKPVIVPGDGTSLWVLTHNSDFAKGFLGLLGNPKAIGEIFHITSDEVLSWNQIFNHLGKAISVEPNLFHVPTEIIAAYDKDWGASLLGDKSHSVIFDNSKIKALVPDFKAEIPFSQGAKEILQWYDADSQRQVINPTANQLIDRIIENMSKAYPC